MDSIQYLAQMDLRKVENHHTCVWGIKTIGHREHIISRWQLDLSLDFGDTAARKGQLRQNIALELQIRPICKLAQALVTTLR